MPTAVTSPWLSGVSDALHPRRAAGAEHEADDGAEVEPDGERSVVAAVGGPPAGDRERHGEHEGDHRPGPDGVPVPARHGHGAGAERRRQPELAGVEDALRVERLLDGDEHAEGGAERLGDEAGPVEADAVVVREVAAVGEHRPLAGVPQRDVRRLDLVRRRRRGEREVEAGAVGVAVRQVAAGDTRVGHGRSAPRARRRTARRAGTTARRSPSCRRRSPCGSAPAAPRCRCGGRASRRRARRRRASPPQQARGDDGHRGVDDRRARPRRARAGCSGCRRRRGRGPTRRRRRGAARPASPRCAAPAAGLDAVGERGERGRRPALGRGQSDGRAATPW